MATAVYPCSSSRCTKLSLLIFVGIVSVVHVCSGMQNETETTDICPEKSTSDETDEESFRVECCANVTCPVGFYESTGRGCNATGHLTNSSGTDDGWTGIICNICHEDCVFSKGCSGPNCEDCFAHGENSTCSNALPVNIIVGATVGGAVFIVLVIVAGIFLCKKFRSRNSLDQATVEVSAQEGGQILYEDGRIQYEEDGRIQYEDGRIQYEEDDRDNMHNNDVQPKESLMKQISQNHDRILRYTPDPTENIPQRPQKPEDDRKSGMYVNQRSVELVQKLFSQKPTKPKHVTKGKKKKAIKADPIYVNASEETQEIDMLPIAPAPPLPQSVSPPVETSLYKGPAYVAGDGDYPNSPQGQSASPSRLSESGLMKGPGYQEGEDAEGVSIKIPTLPAVSQPKGYTKKKKPKSTAPSTKAGILRGPAYKPSEEGESPSGLMKGPRYQAGEEPYENHSVTGSAENRQQAQLTGRKGTKPRMYKGKAVDVTSADSDREDYEEVLPPDAAPVYENFGFSS
ncbi:uncharacterized protein LOC135463594 [Liolophura sinensis]|uniref:uncharacterized protein LOC135463594 n=1 Tax=Liolophura sinensis TaxID=3198878 RepID=UPI00315923EB